jgi:hypothetical protein
VDEDSDASIPRFENIRTRMKRYRAKFMPLIPADIADVDINGEWARTWSGKRFLDHADNDWGILIFTTLKFLRALHQSSAIYLDGTFRTTPPPYAVCYNTWTTKWIYHSISILFTNRKNSRTVSPNSTAFEAGGEEKNTQSTEAKTCCSRFRSIFINSSRNRMSTSKNISLLFSFQPKFMASCSRIGSCIGV